MGRARGSWQSPSGPGCQEPCSSSTSPCLTVQAASCRLARPVKAEWLPSRRASFQGWNPVRSLFSLTFPSGRLLLTWGDFCWELHRVPPQLLLHLMVKKAGVRKTRQDQKPKPKTKQNLLLCWEICFLTREAENPRVRKRDGSVPCFLLYPPLGPILPGSPLPCAVSITSLCPNQTLTSLRSGTLTSSLWDPRVLEKWLVHKNLSNAHWIRLSAMER